MNPSSVPQAESAEKRRTWETTRTGTIPRQETAKRITVTSKFFFQGGKKWFVKGVAYGPFKPRPGPAGNQAAIPFPERSCVESDLDHMRQAGINTVRLYHVPPEWLLDACYANRIQAFITIPWEQHVNFLDGARGRRSIRDRIRKAIDANGDHPAIFAYAVGNEIPAALARWYGPYRVERFIESLVDTARQHEPRPLYTYANFPPTEYLLPGSLDFLCYNIYLHRQADFERYLARLQNLAAEKPLLIGEFGMDTVRHGEEQQADLVRWHIRTVSRMGLAGTVIFSWTDEWFTGGHPIEDWKFGLLDARRQPRKALFEVQRLFKDAHRVPLARYPKVSVIVCSYNGGRTLEACLTSLQQLDYPDYETILVDDGSTDDTPRIARLFPGVKTIHQENLGLSAARNVGLQAATGEVIAYTDSDCVADPDWLYYLVGILEQGRYAAAGGPNISPPARTWLQACVAAAPGQPSHVLLDDLEAEHIPGCNMAFHRWALEAVGGFDSQFRKAGDDVDICWQLLQQGCKIAFSPAAVVWHHRRFDIPSYLRQQAGYGEAEALLRFKHLAYFGATGSARWRGKVYGNPHLSWWMSRPLVYHGVFGMGLFQRIYPSRSSDLLQLMASLEWNVLTFVTFLVALQVAATWYVPVALFACTLAVGLSYGLQARLDPRYHGVGSQALVSLLAIWQPVRRGWARHSTWMKKRRSPRQPPSPGAGLVWDHPARLAFWSESGRGREDFLQALKSRLDQVGWKYSADTGWTNWDYQIYGSHWWQMRLLTLTEEHGDGKRLTRARLRLVPSTLSRFVAGALAVVTLLVLLQPGATTEPHAFKWMGAWLLFVCTCLAFSIWRSARLRRRVAGLVQLAASDCEFKSAR